MLNELKIHYRTLEMVVGNAPPSQPNQENHLDQGVYSTSPTKPRQQHQHLNKGQGKVETHTKLLNQTAHLLSPRLCISLLQCL
jgi:hypothetical protein